MRVRILARASGAMRNASEYVYDPRDLINGQPPGWFLKPDPITPEPDEIEFDHVPTDIEIALAFKRKADETQNG